MSNSIPASECVLEVDQVSVHFGGVKAVNEVSFALAPGLIYGIIGANGSGKSTLLGAISRLTPIVTGTMRIDGVNFEKAAPQRVARLGIGRTFQTVRLIHDLTIFQNVALGADLARKRVDALRDRTSTAREREEVHEALALVGLSEAASRFPNELSYGMQRRVEIARAICTKPRLLIMDEPTAGMNGAERDDIAQLLRELKAEGFTQLIVEHDVPMMVDTCDHLFAMELGFLVASGVPAAVMEDPRVRISYLGKD